MAYRPRVLPLDRCAHQSLPFAKGSDKPQVAGGLPTEAGGGIPSFAAFRVVHVPVVPARDENVRRQRIVVPPHFFDGCIHFAHGVAECREGILQAIGAHLFT
jgi:hypothetical protein